MIAVDDNGRILVTTHMAVDDLAHQYESMMRVAQKVLISDPDSSDLNALCNMLAYYESLLPDEFMMRKAMAV